MKEKIPKDEVVWKKIDILPMGFYAIITTTKRNTVRIYDFDGVEETPITIREYRILSPNK